MPRFKNSKGIWRQRGQTSGMRHQRPALAVAGQQPQVPQARLLPARHCFHALLPPADAMLTLLAVASLSLLLPTL